MALFNRKKKTDETAAPAQAGKAAEKKPASGGKAAPRPAPASAPASAPSAGKARTLSHVLRNPRITEKGTMHAEQSAYLFDVAPSATKHEIAQAISALYNVTPRMVRVVSVPSKRKQNPRTGVHGVKKGGKKAYVYLKKGETITVS